MAKIDIGQILDLGVAVTTALQQSAAKSSTQMATTDVPKVAPPVIEAVKKAIEDQVQPIVDNQTNTEPLWKSRVLRGAIATLVGTAWVAFNDLTDGSIPDPVTIGGYVVAIWGAAYTIYGRITNRGAPSV